jgi:hypothetical protein
MSRGLSWRQRSMLKQLLELEQKNKGTYDEGRPVAWSALDYGPFHEGDEDYSSARVQWNLEQAQRRALRSMAERGLVDLATYSFRLDADTVGPFRQPRIIYTAQHPDDHVPGQSRYMTGVLLTDQGRALATRQS